MTSTQGAVAETSRTLTTSTKKQTKTSTTKSTKTSTKTGTHAIAAASTSAVASPTCTPDKCVRAFETHAKAAGKVCKEFAAGNEKVEEVAVLLKACGVEAGDEEGWMEKVGSVCPCLTS